MQYCDSLKRQFITTLNRVVGARASTPLASMAGIAPALPGGAMSISS